MQIQELSNRGDTSSHGGGGLVAKWCQTLATSRTVACQAPLSMGFSRQEYRSGLPYPPPGDLSDPGTEGMPLTAPALAGGFFTTGATWEALQGMQSVHNNLLSKLSRREMPRV